MSDIWLLAGLGNPGLKYAQTRHNVGQMALDTLASQLGLSFTGHRSNNQIAQGWLRPGGPKLILIKPNSFMNTSGAPVAAAVKYFNVPFERLIVLHDELDIDFDSVRLKIGGGHGGHNGVRDIAKALGTADFNRVRIGIGRPPGRQEVSDFVLSQFSVAERKILPNLLADAVDAATTIVEESLLAAQQKFHSNR